MISCQSSVLTAASQSRDREGAVAADGSRRTAKSHVLPHGVAILVGLMVAVVLVAQIGPDAQPERRLEDALYRQDVLGDLKGAVEQYQAIAGQAGASRELAARAVLGLAHCEEKLGEHAQAQAQYRRLLRDYSDQTEAAAEARRQIAEPEDAISGPRNLNFAEGQPGKVPPGWFVPALPRDADYLAALSRTGCRDSAGCAVVLVPSNAPRPFSSLSQSFSAAAYRGKTVRLRAWLRLESTAPDDRAQMWLSVDRENRQQGFFDNMDDRPIRSSEWTRTEITGPVAPDAQFINIGVMSVGRGRVWVDGVTFEIAGT